MKTHLSKVLSASLTCLCDVAFSKFIKAFALEKQGQAARNAARSLLVGRSERGAGGRGASLNTRVLPSNAHHQRTLMADRHSSFDSSHSVNRQDKCK